MRAGLAVSLGVSLSLCAAAAAADEPTYVLRMAAAIPQGTAWAREMQAFARDVSLATNGQVAVRWYLGGIAGDDVEAGKRVERDQLDGIGAGAWQCERWAPSIAVTRLPGLFHDREESKYVAARLRPLFEEELKKSGYVHLGDAQVGASIVFLRRPVHSFEELKHMRLWSLDVDEVKTHLLGALGLTVVPLSFDQSRPAYDQGRIDGFFAPPTGALAFQWSTETRYVLELPTDYILACLVVSTRAFDRLPFEHQRAVRAAAAKFIARFDDLGAHADRELLGGLFARQGLKPLPVDERMRSDFQAAAHASWDRLDEKLIPKALLKQVQAMLTAYRAANPNH
jgi:TRAP-type C4-dicarboxylate transport system substrate-binding protein